MNTLPSTAALRRLDPDAYLWAAEMLDSREQSFACNALWFGTGHTHEEALNVAFEIARDAIPEVAVFTQVFKPANTDLLGWYGYSYQSHNRSARIFGLLLLRELVLRAQRSGKGRTRS